MKIKSIKQVTEMTGKVVLLRADFNVPLKKGAVAEDYKLLMNLPTIRLLIQNKAKVVIISHFGRPEFTKSGKVKNGKATSLAPVAKRLGKLLRKPVIFSTKVIGSRLQQEIDELKPGKVLMLENIRFYQEEMKNNARFAKQLAKLGDIYVNNALSVSHRNHASVSAIKRYIKSYAGLLLEQELQNMEQIKKPRQPLVVIIGGAKMKTKTEVIKKLSKRASYVLVGGAIANNFLAAKKLPIGKSLSSKEGIRLAKKMLSKKVILPIDVVVAKGSKMTKVKVKLVENVDKTDVILDLGPETMKHYAKYIKQAKTLIWSGPMGKFETRTFRHGTLFMARLVASRSEGAAYGLVGGGETVQALRQSQMFDDVDWVSTGGGAILVYLSGGVMPGLKKIVS